MTKKLKLLTYKSKADFVTDLDLIWSNCLKYNGDLNHPLRRNANSMRKEADKLIPLIPDLVIRPRAEVEAEERRKQNGGEDDAGDDSDDEPIMSSRGRKTGAKGSTKARKNAPGREEGTPSVDQKPILQLNGVLGNIAHDGSDAGLDSNGFATPPIGVAGSVTPMHGINGSQGDGMDLDGSLANGLSLGPALQEDLHEDEEYKIWKQVTKKDRALVAKERNRLFKGDKLNPDEHALLRTKAGMRRWLRQQKQPQDTSRSDNGAVKNATQETLAEGMEGEEERVLPDYYYPLSAIPDIPARLQWVEDADGQVLDRQEECLRVVPSGQFTAPKSALTGRVEANMRQMQETRKLCSKIGVIKQMQLQAQVCLIQMIDFSCTNDTRCIIINSRSTNQSHLLRRILNLMCHLMMVPSWLPGFAKRHYLDLLQSSVIMQGLRNCNRLLLTSLPTLQEIISPNLLDLSTSTAKPRRFQLLVQLPKELLSGKNAILTKKLLFML